MLNYKTDLTHKGWFFFCPVYLNADDGDGMEVEARHPWLDWWFDANEIIFGAIATTMMYFDEDYEPEYPFTVTGKLK